MLDGTGGAILVGTNNHSILLRFHPWCDQVSLCVDFEIQWWLSGGWRQVMMTGGIFLSVSLIERRFSIWGWKLLLNQERWKMTDGDRGDIVGEQITATATAVATAAALLPGVTIKTIVTFFSWTPVGLSAGSPASSIFYLLALSLLQFCHFSLKLFCLSLLSKGSSQKNSHTFPLFFFLRASLSNSFHANTFCNTFPALTFPQFSAHAAWFSPLSSSRRRTNCSRMRWVKRTAPHSKACLDAWWKISKFSLHFLATFSFFFVNPPHLGIICESSSNFRSNYYLAL